jgi:hypothetical protein
MPEPSSTAPSLAALRLDGNPTGRPPAAGRLLLATVGSLAGSLAADALLVAAGTRLFPTIEGYTHFRFSDYGLLTAIGVLVASLAWPVTVRLCSAPRWLFLRLAVLVTLALWLPDLWILVQGQPPRAVAVLAVMHLAIGLVTYNLLVRLAPPRPAADAPGPAPEGHGLRRAGLAMAGLLGAELVLGIGALVVVPYRRPATWLPAQGRLLYLAHAVLGGLLGLGAVAILAPARRAPRIARLGSVVGCAGVVTGAAGGLASVDHATRLLGVGLMFVGTAVAAFGYLMLSVELTPDDPARTVTEG